MAGHSLDSGALGFALNPNMSINAVIRHREVRPDVRQNNPTRTLEERLPSRLIFRTSRPG
jgi:hypothetical protein